MIKRALGGLGYRVEGTRYVPRQLLDPRNLRPLQFDDVVCRRMFDSGPELNFIQIGAYDGVVGDPLRKYIARCGWHGIIVEPQPLAVMRLRVLYGENSNITIIPAALDRTPGVRTLYAVESHGAPDWAGGLASFDRAHVLKHGDQIPGLETMIRDIAVPCVTFDTLLHQAPPRLDLLQIDAEGFDGEILSMFPFDRLRPAILHWEIKHLTKSAREACLGRLAAHGYRFAASGAEDIIAVNF